MLAGFLISVPGLLLLVLAWCGYHVWVRRRRLRLAEQNGSCKICGTPFAEAVIEYHGAISRAERARLDRFQSRFAAFTVLCLECQSLNICTKDGTAFSAKPLQ